MPSAVNPWRLLVKVLVLFVAIEALLTVIPFNPGSLNSYAVFGMLRERLPVSTLPAVDAPLDVGNLDAMLASHVISRPKSPNEYRVLVLGDSAVWGLQLKPQETLPSQLDAMSLKCGTQDVRVYNLSFPRSSATKDLMILDKALAYQPDEIVWLITWYTLMPKTRVDHWLVAQNPDEFLKLARRFDFVPKDYSPPSLLDRIYARNSTMFRWLRYQLYPVIEAASGQEQFIGPPEQAPVELSSDVVFEGLRPPTLRGSQVSLDQVSDFYALAGSLPVLLVNEPIQILDGVPNSDVRYDRYYPRWVYDQYRDYVRSAVDEHGWQYLDLWDAFPARYFADTPLHLTPEGQRLLAERLAPEIIKGCP